VQHRCTLQQAKHHCRQCSCCWTIHCFGEHNLLLLLLLPCCLALEALLAAGAEPDALNVSGAAPLHLAASKAALPAAQLLLDLYVFLHFAEHTLILLLLRSWFLVLLYRHC
jgi:hypothetical protein